MKGLVVEVDKLLPEIKLHWYNMTKPSFLLLKIFSFTTFSISACSHHLYLSNLFKFRSFPCFICWQQVRNWEKRLQMRAREENVDNLCLLAEEHLDHYRKHLQKPGTFPVQSHKKKSHLSKLSGKSLKTSPLNFQNAALTHFSITVITYVVFLDICYKMLVYLSQRCWIYTYDLD